MKATGFMTIAIAFVGLVIAGLCAEQSMFPRQTGNAGATDIPMIYTSSLYDVAKAAMETATTQPIPGEYSVNTYADFADNEINKPLTVSLNNAFAAKFPKDPPAGMYGTVTEIGAYEQGVSLTLSCYSGNLVPGHPIEISAKAKMAPSQTAQAQVLRLGSVTTVSGVGATISQLVESYGTVYIFVDIDDAMFR